MMSSVKMWIVSVMIGAFIVNIVQMLLPDSKLKPYINLVLNFIFVFVVITPIVNFFGSKISMQDQVLKSMNDYNLKYEQRSEELAKEAGTANLAAGYEKSLKEVIKLKLEEYGYVMEDIQIDGSTISSLKIKEKDLKNSNIENETSIESREKDKAKNSLTGGDKAKKDTDKSKQVFKQNNKGESNLDKDKLKDDLVNVLDVSVENIHIDK
ncbi:MAG: stage III sporulation protein AF [Clostridioides sp.]|jgi:stage III sporulation protein AF|nr:stage III sporulation protein AF [Clostridioides sp.]